MVTGASGFVGAEVCRKLIEEGYDVVAVVSPFSKPTRLKSIQKKLLIINANLADEKNVHKIFEKYKPQIVLHLATHGVYRYQQDDENRIVIDNFLMMNHLLRYSVEFGIYKFINTGSVFEYGTRKGKVNGTDVDLADILDKYSAIKMATTALANSYADNLKVLTLRLFTVYGPEEDGSRFIKSTIKSAISNMSIRIAPGVVRDFVYVEDVARAYVNSVKSNFESGEIINIGFGVKRDLYAVAKMIKKVTKSKSEIIIDSLRKKNKDSFVWADISKARKILNWSPKFSMLQGIKKILFSIQNCKQGEFYNGD